MIFDQSVLDFMKELVREAGALTLEGAKALKTEDISCKATAADLVTVWDRKTERFIVDRLMARYPDTGIFGEEYGRKNNDAEWCWIIDPIDGTTNYVYRIPFYCVSVGLWRGGRPVAGAVYAPALDELFSGIADSGAWLNDRPIRVSAADDIRGAMLVTGFACLRAGWQDNNLPYFCRIAPLARGIRRMGSAALDICYVSCGRADAFWELNLALYDFAGAAAILHGAGGCLSDVHGGGRYPEQGVLCSNGRLQRPLAEFFSDYRASRR